MKKIILDTNFLVTAVKFGVDIYSELERTVPEAHELIILDNVLNELEKLSKTDPDARTALNLVNLKNLTIHKGKRIPCDEAIIDFAAENRAILCTLDKELKKKAKKHNLRVIVIRHKSHLGDV